MSSDEITRRKALKTILAVTGGLGAAAFLPSKWLKPVVQSAVLPAHALTSLCPKNLGFSITIFDNHLGLIREIRIKVYPIPAAGTPVSYTLLNILPVNKLAGSLSASSTTDASGIAHFTGTITYDGPPTYSFNMHIEALGCYEEVLVSIGT